MFKPPSYSRCPSWTAANSHYRPFFGRLSTNMPGERNTNKCVVYRFRSSCALVSVWACQVGGGHGFWHFFWMSECVCLCLAVLWMDGNHAGMLYTGQKSLDMLLLGLARLAFWRTHTGLPPCLSLMWTWDEACCPLLWRKKKSCSS